MSEIYRFLGALAVLIVTPVLLGADAKTAQPEAETIAGTEGILATYSATGGAVINLLENTDGTDGGPNKLLSNLKDVRFYSVQRGDNGLIMADDVVLIKINSQWAERGGTNTDLLKGVIEYIINHPSGFKGEIIIADNGQGMFGSEGKGGRLDWPRPNSKDQKQSAQNVIDHFSEFGIKISGISWDKITKKRVAEFSSGDNNDGFVVLPGVKNTGIQISYAKFTTVYGTPVSFKFGVWNEASKTYDERRLRLINIPVLKVHSQYHVTGAVKAYMGIPSNALTDMSAHKSVGTGGMGTLMVHTRFPLLNILDMIYICPQRGPPSAYSTAVQKNMIAASTDPFALDVWASTNILIPAAEAAGYTRIKSMYSDSREPGSFGYWLSKSAAEVKAAGIPVVTNSENIAVYNIE
ncbi:MAG: DUF362 domain-containing protein [Spirochaetaceae bacterium]|nr:DUF362 domain-containing protein [Spirochaetaceae bacterium]